MVQKITHIKFAAFFITLIILIQTGCKKNDAVSDNGIPVLETPVITNDAIKVAATISGSVIDENNQPVANAVVTSDTYTGSTDAMGNFTFRNINVSAANGHVTVIKAGYFKGIRSFVTEAGKNNFVKIQLIKQTLTGTITAATGGTVTDNGAVISFPANAFITAGGAAYTGSVKVFAHWIDPTAANLPLVVPGDLRAITSSNGEFLLKSYGMVGAELQDASGNILKIAPGKTATITFPIPTSLQGTAPASIPLWHFDEATARWKEEGNASKSGNTYTAFVNKFSFWNVDVPANFITLDMRLLNSANNLPLANTLVKITSLATNTYAYDHTNDSGYVSGYVPKNEALKLEVITGTNCNGNTVVHTQNIGPYTANASLGNISVTIPANLVINFTATIKGCNNLPVTNGYISLSLANGTSTIAYTNAAGLVNFSLIHCGGTIAYTYNAVDLSNGNYSSTATGTATGNSVNLGSISACGNTINTNGVYIAGIIDDRAVFWKDGVPTFLTATPTTANNYAYAVKTLVYNNDVYVLVSEQDSTLNGWVGTIKLWKNGVITNITNGTTLADAYSFDVYNGDVYICGIERNSNNPGSTVAKVWKNGVATILPKDTFDYVEATNIKVVNGDVYVCGQGFTGFNSRALYWKNGIINILANAGSTYSYTSGIFVNNGDIYITGTESTNGNNINPGVYWKNSVKTLVTLPASYTYADPYSVFVDNNDVYITGTVVMQSPGSYLSNATYWKNNSINFLTNYNT
ncbi:MAG: carboxypeptidase-like regulatory domain-containing protein, partial [Ferruginibacter sp.]